MAEAEVEVILPTHRRPHTIEYSIAAVLGQTHARLTLHVVGDGCDDATVSAARRFGDARVVVHRFAKARGFGYANRNRVLRAGRAPFVAYANDDDLWFPDHLERALATLEQRRLDLVAFRSIHVQPPDRLDPYFFAFDWQTPLVGRLLRHWFLGAGTIVHRRRVFEQVGYWNEGLFRFGDREFFNRVRVSPLPSAYIDHVSVLRFYAQHWDAHYAALPEPPQRRYLQHLGDDEWRTAIRAAAVPGRRPLSVRLAQWSDFARFGLHSGPKFARFWYERRRNGADGGATQRSGGGV